jgi:hypothetical protein
MCLPVVGSAHRCAEAMSLDNHVANKDDLLDGLDRARSGRSS